MSSTPAIPTYRHQATDQVNTAAYEGDRPLREGFFSAYE